MNNGRLILHPLDSSVPLPDQQDLIQYLRHLEFIGGTLPGPPPRFLLGEHFLRHITFLGCSPYVRLEPDSPEDQGFCHLLIQGPYAEPRLLHGKNTRPPRCPGCNQAIPQWHQQLDQTQLTCPQCQQTSPLSQLGWRHNGGAARLFIEIRNIFPGEAVPVQPFMDQLASEFGQPWDYFYLLT